MTQRDMAGYLGVDTKTLYNWRKEKPNLYRTILLGFKFMEAVEESRKSYEKLKRLGEELGAKSSKP